MDRVVLTVPHPQEKQKHCVSCLYCNWSEMCSESGVTVRWRA
jgi:hypothetical protein